MPGGALLLNRLLCATFSTRTTRTVTMLTTTMAVAVTMEVSTAGALTPLPPKSFTLFANGLPEQ